MLSVRKIIFLLSVLIFAGGFAQEKKKKTPAYLYELKSRADFDQLKGEPLSNTFKGIECVKLVYVLASKTLYYLESKRYKWHYRFTSEILGDTDELEEFNNANYGRHANRKYILATFNYNTSTGNYFLQFTASDDPADELIDILVKKVTATFFLGKKFKILLNTTIMMRRKKELEQKHEVITSDEMFANQVYQPICKGKASGIVKFVHADSLKQNVDYSKYILVLHGSSNQIPICKAVVTDEFQTPLSHICLLTNNRKTPSAAQKGVFSDAEKAKLNGKFMQLEVGEDKMSFMPATVVTEKKKAGKIKRLIADTVQKEIADLNALSYKDRVAYGTKACNLAELKMIERRKKTIVTPKDAMAVPFYYYVQHIKKSGAAQLIAALTRDSAALTNDSLLDKRLKQIRAAIRKFPIDKAFNDKISSLCAEKFGKAKTRFRSSSNCEDEAGFNGAGLYTSESGIAGDTSKSIEAAIKKVWASLWSNRAFKERQYFSIDHNTVCMGMLVHQTFDNEILNGVAITKNLYRDYEFGFVINLQQGEEEVVSPRKGMICEQVVSYMNNKWADFYNSTRSADWISYSSIHPGSSLLSSDELLQLTEKLETIKKHFYELYKLWPKVEYKDFALDVEFKMIETPDKKRIFIFKQARPYNNG